MNLNITNNTNTNTNTTPTCGILYQYWVYIQLCVSMCIGTLKANNNPYKSTLLECLDRVFMINNRYPMGNSSNRSSSTGVYGGNNDINSCKNSTNDNGINNNSNTNSNNDMTIQYILQLICAIMIPDVLYWIKIAIVYSCTHPIYSTTNKIMSYLYHSCLYQLLCSYYIRYIQYKKFHDDDSDSEIEYDGESDHENSRNSSYNNDKHSSGGSSSKNNGNSTTKYIISSPYSDHNTENPNQNQNDNYLNIEEDHFEDIEDSEQLYTLNNYRRINTHSQLFLNRMESAIQRTMLELDSHV